MCIAEKIKTIYCFAEMNENDTLHMKHFKMKTLFGRRFSRFQLPCWSTALMPSSSQSFELIPTRQLSRPLQPPFQPVTHNNNQKEGGGGGGGSKELWRMPFDRGY